ncbi:MAG: hypothetical protein RLZZ426_468, partial [Actinomycetota bacterium]
AYENAVSASIELAHQTAALIETLPHIELVREPGLSVVLWHRTGWSPADYDAMQEKLLSHEVAFVTPTKWEGETIGRFAFLHPATTLDMVKKIFEMCE